jgi:hypothetical protein
MEDTPLAIRQIARDVPQGWKQSVIAMNDAVDVLRHGWQDAAGIFAPDSPEIAELLQARLEMAVANRSLDENHLLGAIDDVESMAASTGSPSGQALARRLRRTVYEYLLALDAAPAPVLAVQLAAPAQAPIAATPEPDAHVEAEAEPEEVSALGHRAAPAHDTATAPTKATADAAADVTPGEAPVTDDLERVDGAEQDDDRPGPGSDSDAAAEAPDQAQAAPPTWQFHPATELPATAAGPSEPQTAAPAPVAAEVSTPPAPAELAADENPDGFVAPRAGFHVIEDTHPTHAPSQGAESPLQMPAFATPEADAPSAAITPAPQATTAPATPGHTEADLATYQWTRPGQPPEAPASAPTPEANGVTPVAQPPAPEHPGIDSDIDPENGWHVRRGMGKGEAAAPAMDEDPFENNPRLADLRRRIDERLRRKKCDEAAALLQELAQETGGRVVAELAMNAGDRCQSLGKSNAALNCYLAGSRADPVYELPLSRLADICIDDQDTELAVSYLERIARLYRFRGDDKAALRVYRRIATIAPYREDVLTLLLNVQNTGRFES